MPRKYKDKEINDMRRMIDIMQTHPQSAHKRMFDFVIGHLDMYPSKNLKPSDNSSSKKDCCYNNQCSGKIEFQDNVCSKFNCDKRESSPS